MPEIEWRDVPGYEGLYLINAEGQVYNLGTRQTVTVFTSQKDGYVVPLSKDGRLRNRSVGRLLAMAFLGMPADTHVQRKNGDKYDNHLENLTFSLTSGRRIIPKRRNAKKNDVDGLFWEKIVWDWSDGCWEWNRSLAGGGYGQLSWNKKTVSAHRFSWLINRGEIPEGLVVRHKCDNKRCVNPDHLELGTQKDNVQDAIDRGLFGAANYSRDFKSQERKEAVEKVADMLGMKLVDVVGAMLDFALATMDFEHMGVNSSVWETFFRHGSESRVYQQALEWFETEQEQHGTEAS